MHPFTFHLTLDDEQKLFDLRNLWDTGMTLEETLVKLVRDAHAHEFPEQAKQAKKQ